MKQEGPYLDNEWDDVPLPDGDAAWQKMELLLDKEDRRRGLPFWFWRYAGYGLLLVGLAAGAWLLTGRKAEEAKAPTAESNPLPPSAEGNKEQVAKNKETVAGKQKRSVLPAQQPATQPEPKAVATPETAKAKEKTPSPIVPKKTAFTNPELPAGKRQKVARETKPAQPNPLTPSEPLEKKTDQKVTGKDVNIVSSFDLQTPVLQKADSVTTKTTVQKDTTAAKDTVAAKPAPPVVKVKEKKAKPEPKTGFVWSAGIGFQKAIALSNQKSTTGDTAGRKRYFFDYFPSVYVKLQRDKWFAQAELAYSVPQPVQSFSFSQKTTYNSSALTLNTQRAILQKLYYHQLSLSLNYHPLPQWSVGAGLIQNRLAGAVTERENVSKNVQTGAESYSKYTVPVKGYTDSFFYKSTASLLLQTDYHLKRFSLGLRYTKNLQPFMTYTKPDGTVLNEKNSVLQAVLRFRLWESK